MIKMETPSLTNFAESILKNFKSFKNYFIQLHKASEGINQAFDTLLSMEINEDREKILLETLNNMLFGSHVAWINSYIFTVAGYKSSGLVELRRAIEFCCYAAKVGNSKKRAKLWIDQGTNEEARKNFKYKFSIPDAYKKKKYSFLRSLIIIHNEANYYGAHGNFESVIYNYSKSEKGEKIFHYQMNKKYIPNSAGEIILTGFRILQAYNYIFEKDNYIKETNTINKVLEYVEEQVQEARIKLANREYKGFIPNEILKNIKQDKKEAVNKIFTELFNEKTQ